MTDNKARIDQLNDLLPQTQCRDCEYQDCQDYARAMINEGECIDKCLPGGETVLRRLAHALDVDPAPYIDSINARAKSAKMAVIREDECIGCTKCITACPVDAIIGAPKYMHTVITDACTGCNLCVPPCPVDCIDLITLTDRCDQDVLDMAPQSKQRYQQHQQRKEQRQQHIERKHQQAKLKQSSQANTKAARQQAIAAALERAKQKKQNDSQ